MLDNVAKMFKAQPQQQQQMTAEPARSTSDVVSQQPVSQGPSRTLQYIIQ